MIVTKEYLIKNPNHIFVFGDNIRRKGKLGGSILRDMYNTYGFVTKKSPNNRPDSFYTPREYLNVYNREIKKLAKLIKLSPNETFLISKLGGGLANKYRIFEEIIEPRIKRDLSYPNVEFLW